MEPTTIVGAVIGSYVNKLLPPVIILFLLVLILGLTGYRTMTKGIRTLKKEGGIMGFCTTTTTAAVTTATSPADNTGTMILDGSMDGLEAGGGGGGRENDEMKTMDGHHHHHQQGVVPLSSSSSSSSPPSRTSGVDSRRPPPHRQDSSLVTSFSTALEDSSSNNTNKPLPPPPPANHSTMMGRSLTIPALIGYKTTNQSSSSVEMVVLPPPPSMRSSSNSSSFLSRLTGTECTCGRHIDVCGGCADKAWASGGGSSSGASSSSSSKNALTQKALPQLASDNISGSSSTNTSIVSIISLVKKGQTTLPSVEYSQEEKDELLHHLLEQEKSTRLWKPAMMVVILGGVIAFNILKGSRSSPLLDLGGCGSVGYWSLSLMTLPWVMIFIVIIRSLVLEEYKKKIRANFPFVEGDMRWCPTSTIRYPIICVLAGLVAGE